MLGLLESLQNILYIISLNIITLNGVLVCLFLLKRLLFDIKFIENEPNSLSLETNSTGSDLQFCQIQFKCEQDSDCSLGSLKELNSLDSIDLNEELPTIIEGMTFNINRKESVGYVGTIYSTQVSMQNNHEQEQLLERNSSTTRTETLRRDVRELQRIEATFNRAHGQSVLLGKLIDINRIQEVVWEANSFGTSIVSRVIASDPEWVQFISKFQSSFWNFLEIASRLQGISQTNHDQNSTMMSLHPNVLYYERLLVQTNSTETQQFPHSKDSLRQFRVLRYINRREWPAALLLVFPRADMNLRTILLAKMSQFTSNTAIHWARELGNGISFLNSVLGAPHRNLKPENVLLYRNRTDLDISITDSSSDVLASSFRLKISDYAQALLIPTSSRVLSAGSSIDILQLSPCEISRNSENIVDAMHVDAYCFAMIVLLMFLKYEQFQENFMIRQFPYAILALPRYRIDLLIGNFTQIPVNLKVILIDVFKPQIRTTVSKIIHHESFFKQ